MTLTRAIVCVLCALLLDASPGQADETSGESRSAVRATETLFTREAELGACDTLTIPFVHPERPTVYLESGCVSLPLLFDTGTFAPIFISDGWFLDPGMLPLAPVGPAAGLDGKADWQAYGYLELIKLGGVRARNVPFRIFGGAGGAKRDYAGAFAPVMFQAYVIEISNSRLEIMLHDRKFWLPPQPAYVLPILTLPRGTFAQLELSGETLWFHLDSGFSGSLGILPGVVADHPRWFGEGEGPPVIYQGWSAPVVCTPLVIHSLSLPVYGNFSWVEQEPLGFSDLPAVQYQANYSDAGGLSVGGIMGSAFLSRFDYALDYRAGRLYLWTE